MTAPPKLSRGPTLSHLIGKKLKCAPKGCLKGDKRHSHHSGNSDVRRSEPGTGRDPECFSRNRRRKVPRGRGSHVWTARGQRARGGDRRPASEVASEATCPPRRLRPRRPGNSRSQSGGARTRKTRDPAGQEEKNHLCSQTLRKNLTVPQGKLPGLINSVK